MKPPAESLLLTDLAGAPAEPYTTDRGAGGGMLWTVLGAALAAGLAWNAATSFRRALHLETELRRIEQRIREFESENDRIRFELERRG